MKKLLPLCAVILASIVMGFLLLCLVYCIPTRMMVDGGYESGYILEGEGKYGYEHFSLRALDNFTDAVMLNTASYYSGESVWKSAIEAFRAAVPDKDAFESYVMVASGAEVEAKPVSYSRYWHGYLLFLKPLYALFNYTQIRNINLVLQLSMLIITLVLLNKKYPELSFPFIISVMLLAPSAIYKSLQFSSMYYVMLFSAILFLWNPRNVVSEKNMQWFFLGVGITTVYLDFLTFPTVTLTIPLLLLCRREKDGKIKDSLKLVLKCALMWGTGYVLMWAGKWVLALMSGQQAFLDELISSIKFRSSAKVVGDVAISRVGTLKKTFEETFNSKLWAMTAATFSAVCFIRIAANLRYIRKEFLRLGLLLLVPIMCSLVWILVLANHTSIHIFFTYRTVVPVVFCVLSFLSVLAETVEAEKLKSKVGATCGRL